MRDFRDAKAMAHGLRDALKSRAVETTHSDCLELIAKSFGYDNWNILAAKIEASGSRAAEEPGSSPAGAREPAPPDPAAPRTLYCSPVHQYASATSASVFAWTSSGRRASMQSSGC
jgi:hypothetical protein